MTQHPDNGLMKDSAGRLVVVQDTPGSDVTIPVAGSVTAATLANVASSASSVALFASNSAARGRMVFNDSTAILSIAFGSSAASATNHVVQVPPAGYYEFPQPVFTGAVKAIWATANGSARTTEV